ncbi:hypothetical protein [Alkalimarinus alittae]|uniref:Uncharacterized protein n=1 Tax=Alkalimarinus alittae TaxID=2961619 RepID=A0ABY6MX24_9ALTE|nr:hypothetical protein [Alkalimarinus alittae]UZE94386.1 hypothetical protein NKI27_09785 [Alkalimarinus alittae]
MSSLYVNGKSDGSKLLKKTEIDQSKLGDYIAIIKEHELIGHCPTTEDNVLTEKGEKACQDIFKNVVIRKRIELKKEIQSVERICSQVQ